MNVVALVIDTLRYDAVAWHGAKPWMHTPNLDRLVAWFAREGRASFPEDLLSWRGPPRWAAYRDRRYNRW